MKKDKNFAESKLKNLLDGNKPAMLELTDKLKDKIDRLPPQQNTAAPYPQNKRAFYRYAAALCVIMVCAAFMLPVLLKDGNIYNNLPESGISDTTDIADTLGLIEFYTKKNFALQESDKEFPSCGTEGITVYKAVKFTAASKIAGIGFLEEKCGLGSLNVVISYFSAESSGFSGLNSIIFINGNSGSLRLSGGGSLTSFSSANTLRGAYTYSGEKTISVTIDTENKTLLCSVDGICQKSYVMDNYSENNTETSYPL